MKKNLFLKGTAIGLCMAMLTACGASSSASSADTQTSATAKDGVTTLKVGVPAPAGSFQFDVLTTLNENLQETSGGTMNLDIAAGTGHAGSVLHGLRYGHCHEKRRRFLGRYRSVPF